MVVARQPLGDPAADAARFLRRLAFALLFIVVPVAEALSHGLIYSLFPIGAVILVITGLLIGFDKAPRRIIGAFLTPIGVGLGFLAFWCALSLVWAPFPGDAAARLARTLLTAGIAFLAIIALPERTKISNIYLLPIGVALTALATFGLSLFGPESFRQGVNADYALAQRCIMTLAILVWPAIGALALRERLVMAAALAILVAAATLAGFIQSALAAFMVAAVIYVAAMTYPERVAKVMAIGLAILVLGAPLFVVALHPLIVAPHSFIGQPTAIFSDLVLREWPRFITGHGLGMAERAMELGVLPPTAPQSIVFTLWYELGIVGVAAFVFLLRAVVLAAGRVTAHTAPAFLALIAAGFVIGLFGAETTQLWWMTVNGIGALALALLNAAHPRLRRPPAPPPEDEFEEDDVFEVYEEPDF